MLLGKHQAKLKQLTLSMNNYLRLWIISKALSLSKSTYLLRQTIQRDRQDISLKNQIFEIQKSNYKAYEYPQIVVAMRRLGIVIGPNRIYQLIKKLVIRLFKKPGTHVKYFQRPNLIKNHPIGTTWYADITYLTKARQLDIFKHHH